jgi:tRNA A37 threonylcarbamoyltransferase TsaD
MEEGSLSQEQVLLLATVFEEAALSILKLKLEQALRTYPDVHEVWLGGGVSANKYLQELLIDIAKERKLTIRMPASGKLMTDNAAMVGIVAGLKLTSGASDGIYSDPEEFEEIDRIPNLSV